MNALASAISAIADQPAVSVASGTVAASWPAETTTTTSAAETASTTTTTSAGPAKPRTTGAASARPSRSAWSTSRLAWDANSQRTAGGTLHAQQRPTQSEIILAVLQARAQSSIHQEGFVGVA
jgi:hypothetical protein